MPLDMPPNYNVSTQFKHKVEIVSYLTSTRIDDLPEKLNNTFNLNIDYFHNFANATKFILNEESFVDNSTWSDFMDENFDVISKLSYSKVFKVRAKIKTISRFTPKIVID